jgi:hypothetical protein
MVRCRYLRSGNLKRSTKHIFEITAMSLRGGSADYRAAVRFMDYCCLSRGGPRRETKPLVSIAARARLITSTPPRASQACLGATGAPTATVEPTVRTRVSESVPQQVNVNSSSGG